VEKALMSNNISERWYRNKRAEVDDKIEDGKVLSEKRKEYESPQNKYILSITPVAFKEDNRYWAYTIGKVYKKLKNKTGEHICTIYRNSEKFPFVFLENQDDGHDYFISGEDYQGQTVVQLDTKERYDFIGEKAKRDMEFCWQKFHQSPNKQIIAVEGHAKNKPTEMSEYRSIRFFKFEDKMALPYEEYGNRISFHYDDAIGWEDDEHFLVSVIEDRRKDDLKRVKDLPKKERMKCLEDNNFGRRNIVYRVPILGGEEDIKEVYSEWLPT
tara:strand:+ start:4175 stop:4984 length:810 start_codon:yes stop_codon:yes gene_type:complete